MNITLSISLDENTGIRAIVFANNDTPLPSNSETLKKIALTILEAISINHDELQIQDVMNDLE